MEKRPPHPPAFIDNGPSRGYNHSMGINGIIDIAYEAYGAMPEYLWKRYPEYCVLRRAGNRKWFAVLMEVPKASLGLPGGGKAQIMNVKCEPVLLGSLLQRPGFLPAWHMNKEKWLSVLLDGSVPEAELRSLLDMSFALTAKAK